MRRRAFTLIELLASMAIFFVIVAAGLSLLSATSNISSKAKLRVEIREEARNVFDRMALDLAALVHFDSYQIALTDGGNPTMSLLVKAGGSESVRLQRIDYFVESRGLFRAVRNFDWEGKQDLSEVPQGAKELLSPSVGRMLVGTYRADNSSTRTESEPSTRGPERPVGLSVALVMMDAKERSQGAVEEPSVTTNASNLSVSLPESEAARGWKLSEKAFRLP
jgi:prepilin-type N-terminal cleavage/methylation domain-containing protein